MNEKTVNPRSGYFVARIDHCPVGDRFVLELTDSTTWTALWEWADVLNRSGYQKNAQEIYDLVQEYRNRDRAMQEAERWLPDWVGTANDLIHIAREVDGLRLCDLGEMYEPNKMAPLRQCAACAILQKQEEEWGR